jgi:hypothetical protein
LRTLRNGVVGVTAHIWYRRDDDWVEDLDAAPVWTDDKEVAQWVDRLMLPRLTTTPSGIALELLDAVTDPSLHLYPSEIRKGSPPVWALRIDGLEIGTASQDIVNLSVGKPSKTGVDRRQRADFIEVFGAANVAVSHEGSAPPALLDVQAAAARIRLLLLRFRAVDVPGAPVAHRSRNGVRFIDEHALEARLLKGLTTIEGATLIRDDDQVARGSQFQTKWGRTGRPRYLDAMLRRGTTPLAVELKVATGGQGRYYRRSVLQAVLYRHFILNTPALDPWFEAVGLPRLSIEAAVGIPYPQEWSVSFDRSFTGLRRVAARFGVEVHLVDDRATPEWTMHPPGPDPDDDSTELHSWRLAA